MEWQETINRFTGNSIAKADFGDDVDGQVYADNISGDWKWALGVKVDGKEWESIAVGRSDTPMQAMLACELAYAEASKPIRTKQQVRAEELRQAINMRNFANNGA